MLTVSGEAADASIREDTAGGTVLFTATASDADGQPITYSLEDNSGLFEIDATTGEIRLKSNASLDYENAPRHSLKVTATAGVTLLMVGRLNPSTLM